MRSTMSDSQHSVCFECRQAVEGDTEVQTAEWEVVRNSECWACRRRMLEALPSLIQGTAPGPRPQGPTLRLVTALDDEADSDFDSGDWPEPA